MLSWGQERDLLAAKGVDDYAALRFLTRQLSSLSGCVIFLSAPFFPSVIPTPLATFKWGPMRPWGGNTNIGKRRERVVPVGRYIFLLLLLLVVEPLAHSS